MWFVLLWAVFLISISCYSFCLMDVGCHLVRSGYWAVYSSLWLILIIYFIYVWCCLRIWYCLNRCSETLVARVSPVMMSGIIILLSFDTPLFLQLIFVFTLCKMLLILWYCFAFKIHGKYSLLRLQPNWHQLNKQENQYETRQTSKCRKKTQHDQWDNLLELSLITLILMVLKP